MKPELAELPVLATLSRRRFISSLSSQLDPDDTTLPSWLWSAHIQYIVSDTCGFPVWLLKQSLFAHTADKHAATVMRKEVLRNLNHESCDLPCTQWSHLSCFSNSWTSFHICRTPRSSSMGLLRCQDVMILWLFHSYSMWWFMMKRSRHDTVYMTNKINQQFRFYTFYFSY